MRRWTFGAILGALAFGSANALDNCDSDVLVKAFAGLNVNTELISCMTKNNFSAALNGSVDLTSVSADTAPRQVKTICASDSCNTILLALVGSANFELTNCIVGKKLVLKAEISTLHATCTALSATANSTLAASTEGPAATSTADNKPQQNVTGGLAATTNTTKEVQPSAMPAPTEVVPTTDNKPHQNEPTAPTPAPNPAPAPPSTPTLVPASNSAPAPVPAPASTVTTPTDVKPAVMAPTKASATPTAAPTAGNNPRNTTNALCAESGHRENRRRLT